MCLHKLLSNPSTNRSIVLTSVEHQRNDTSINNMNNSSKTIDDIGNNYNKPESTNGDKNTQKYTVVAKYK